MSNLKDKSSTSSTITSNSTRQPARYTPPLDPPTSKVVLITAGFDHTIRFWDVLKGVTIGTLQHTASQVNSMAVSRDKRTLAVAGNPQIKIFDTTGSIGTPLHVYEGHRTNVTTVAFQRDNRWIFSASEDGTIRVWDLRSSRCQREINNSIEQEGRGARIPITQAVLHPNQVEVITSDVEGGVRIWDVGTKRCSNVLHKCTANIIAMRSVSVSQTGDLIASANDNGQLNLWTLDNNSSTGYTQYTHQAHDTFITRCLFSPNSQLLATMSADSTTKLWDPQSLISTDLVGITDTPPLGTPPESADMDGQSGEKSLQPTPLQSLIGHTRWVWDAAFSADSAYIVTASSDGTSKLWDANSGESVCTYIGHQKAVTAIAMNDFTDVP